MEARVILWSLRRMLRITRAELARLADVNPSTIGRIERGTLDPTWGMLCRFLESGGVRISGEHVVPSGDITALCAARIMLDHEVAIKHGRSAGSPIVRAVLEQQHDGTTVPTSNPATAGAETHASPASPDAEGPASSATLDAVRGWLHRWRRLGWLSREPTAAGLHAMAVAAGHIAAIEHRTAPRLSIGDHRSWKHLARRLGDLGIDYAVSGLMTPELEPISGTSPAIFVRTPAEVAARTGWRETAPETGIRLIHAEGLELEGTAHEDGIRFVSPVQSLLNGVAGRGEESVSAGAALRFQLLARHRGDCVPPLGLGPRLGWRSIICA